MRIEKYALKLNLSKKDDSFHGEETISLSGEGDHLVLDGVSMKFNSVLVNGRPADFRYEEDQLSIVEEINGPTDIFIDFEGKYSTSLNGMYLAKTPNGKMISTQFESTGARMAFPCIDNPSFKAEFDLSLIIESGEEAISNMPKKGETFFNGTKIVEFEKTPRMSTYLLYIGVGKFDHLTRDFKGKELILTAPKGLFNSTEEPLDVAAKVIDYYEKYYDIEFVLPKMHLIAVPEFAAGAMENWGAITFREIALFLNKDTGTQARATIYMVIAHEIAHQWFGDLVTMKWWEDLWLNESFANFMGYKSIDSLFPELDMWALYFNMEMSHGLLGDSLKSTHPIHVRVDSPEAISQIFDEISYNKGGTILRMIESFMGQQSFRDGIREYLKTHSFSNAASSDLWSSLDRHSDFNINEIMECWINLPGHPVVYASKKGDRIELRQKTFKLLGSYEGDLWKIPLTLLRTSGPESMLLEQRDGTAGAGSFIKLNVDTSGFYRCYYDNELFEGIVANMEKLTSYDVWGLVNDNYDFLLSDDISFDTYMNRLKHFMDSNDPLIIRTVTRQLASLSDIAGENEELKSVARDYLRNKLEALGDIKKDEAPGISMTRSSVSNALVRVDGKYAEKMGSKVKELDSIEPDMRQSVLLGYAVSKNDPELLLSLLSTLKTDEDKSKVISAMGSLSGQENLSKAVAAINSGLIKAQDMVILYGSFANDSGRDYFLEHFHEIYNSVKSIFAGSIYMSMLVEQAFPFMSIRNREKAEKLLETVKDPESTSGVSKAREYIEIYGRLKEKL